MARHHRSSRSLSHLLKWVPTDKNLPDNYSDRVNSTLMTRRAQMDRSELSQLNHPARQIQTAQLLEGWMWSQRAGSFITGPDLDRTWEVPALELFWGLSHFSSSSRHERVIPHPANIEERASSLTHSTNSYGATSLHCGRGQQAVGSTPRGPHQGAEKELTSRQSRHVNVKNRILTTPRVLSQSWKNAIFWCIVNSTFD